MYVVDGASGDGTSWGNAYGTLSEAIDAAPGFARLAHVTPDLLGNLLDGHVRRVEAAPPEAVHEVVSDSTGGGDY